jgi:hypothetical protein
MKDQLIAPTAKRIRSYDGQIANYSSDRWSLRTHQDAGDKVTLDFQRLRGTFNETALETIKLYLADRLKSRHVNTVRHDYDGFCKFAEFLKVKGHEQFSWESFTSSVAHKFLSWCKKRLENWGVPFCRLCLFYEDQLHKEVAGFETITLGLLNTISPPPILTGHNARSRHPTKAAFIPSEIELIKQAVRENRGEETDLALIRLCLETGSNPTPLARLVNKDLIYSNDQYSLNMPASKSRSAFRSDSGKIPISSELGKLLDKLREEGEEGDRLLHWLNEDAPSKHIGQRMRTWAKSCQIISPRTNQVLHLSPRRFRCQLTTDLLQEGAPPESVAHYLGHKGLSCLSIYESVSPTIGKEIAAATDWFMEPLIACLTGDATQPLPSIQPGPNLNERISYSRQNITIGKVLSPEIKQSQDDNRQKICDLARDRFKKRLGKTGQDFAASCWDISSLQTQYRGPIKLYFSQKKNGKPWPDEYANVVKLWVLDQNTPASMHTHCRVARNLWRIVGKADFCWSQLERSDFQRFVEEGMDEHGAVSQSHWNDINILNKLVDLAISLGLSRPRIYEKGLLVPDKSPTLPSPNIINQIAYLYRNVTDPGDRLLICTTLLLFLTGLSFSELQTLPVACMVEEKRDGRTYYGLLYHVDQKNGKSIHDTRWLSPTTADFVKTVIAEIQEITAPAREQARFLESDPSQIRSELLSRIPCQTAIPCLDGLDSGYWVFQGKIADLWGYKFPLRTKGVLGTDLVHLDDFVQYIRTCHPLWVKKLDRKKYQMLSETLLVTYKGFFSRKSPQSLLVESVKLSAIHRFLGNNNSTQSIFQRFDLCDADGNYPSVKTGQVRRLLLHIANEGGLSPENKARWLGRKLTSGKFDRRQLSLNDEKALLDEAMGKHNQMK